MLIEEIIRSCANERVACAAVASIGRGFSREMHEAAEIYGMSVGGFTALSVERFACHGDEGEMRSVRAAMEKSQEPILAGLHRILCIMRASALWSGAKRPRERLSRMAAQLCAMEDGRRERFF